MGFNLSPYRNLVLSLFLALLLVLPLLLPRSGGCFFPRRRLRIVTKVLRLCHVAVEEKMLSKSQKLYIWKLTTCRLDRKPFLAILS